MSLPPSMVHKAGNRLVVRSVVSGDKLFGTSETDDEIIGNGDADADRVTDEKRSPPPSGGGGGGDVLVEPPDEELPQCKVKRNYACSSCSYYTQNPRYYLHHLKNVHKEKIRIYECPHCLYASKHSQKLQRHIHMVHVMGKRKLLIKTKTSTGQKNPSPVKEVVAPLQSPSPGAELRINEDSSPLPPPSQSQPPSSLADDPVDGVSEGRSASSVADGEDPLLMASETVDQSDRPLKCSLCSFSSRNPNLVTRHERLVHLKKKFYRCTKCDYITHMKARFTKHVKYHSMPMIKCDMCDFRTPYKWNLDRHNKNHFANGAFKCSQCNFTADIKQSLTVHEMNHHVPPVNQNGAGGLTVPTPAKRRCRVGASDIVGRQETSSVEPDFDDLELLRMERESLPPPPPPTLLSSDANNAAAVTSDEVAQMAAVEITMVKPNVPGGCKMLNLKNPTAAAYLNGTLKPEDVILTKTGSVYVKKFKCRVCQYKAAWESEMIRHEVRVHGLEAVHKKKSLPRPIPNLIPIQNNNGNGGTGGGSPTSTKQKNANANKSRESPMSMLKNGLVLPEGIPFVDSEFEKPLTEKDLNDIYAKSCATSSLKDFASLIGAEESLKSDRLKDFMSMFAHTEEKGHNKTEKTDASKPPPKTTAETTESGPDDTKKIPDSFKKKNATFFDRLKEKLMVGAGENGNLACWCGHKSKCLSESVIHQKTHTENLNDKNEKLIANGPLISGAELSSTRCQHCRQRCKTSSDLFAHLQSCPEMGKKGSDPSPSKQPFQNNEPMDVNGTEEVPMEEDAEIEDEPGDTDKLVENHEPSKEENKVFVWNNFSLDKDDDDFPDDESRSKSPASESSLVGYEIAPGIGSVIPNNNEDNAENFKFNNMNIDLNNTEGSAKKVFKCPTCNFWASTASRFHVHIVSHMNVKPFGCSVCPYQSKWKWDVTKHIKLKKERDPSHERAEMRTIDVETGRRNYTKYNRFLTIMRVHEPQLDILTKSSTTNVPTPVPILPKLTPAPSVNGDVEKDAVVSSDVSMRPLPMLHPANPAVSMKRPHDPVDDSEIPKKKIPSEKKMWKCKKCKFRNTDRNIVLSHVKEHYTSGSQNSNDPGKMGPNSELYNAYSQEFRNRIENQENNRNDSIHPANDESNQNNASSENSAFRCDICNFETDCLATFRFHNQHHEDNPSALYRCCFCPFFANDKQFMLNHVSSHGVENAEESLPLIRNNVSSKKINEEERQDSMMEEGYTNISEGSINRSDLGMGEEMEIFKRFKCGSCPYVTNNKSQYLYHKQFHRLRNAPFKCNICSYNVTKRHLLHQHLKIHGVKRAQFKSCIKDAVEKESPESGFTLNTDVETVHLPDIPLVWVHKAGALTKMFKCRHCPHVNLRKSNIHEHEKMHFDRIQRSPNGSITTNQTSAHRCTDCNYVCNNAGALASHFKVHQGAFGQICALADPRRSDESQIREITRLMKDDDRFKKDPPAAPTTTGENQSDAVKKILATTVDVSPLNSSKTESGEVANQSTDTATTSDANKPTNPNDRPILYFCTVCPARFQFQKDLESHSRFHSAHHTYKCNSCTYSAPQQAQLMAHKRVHTNEYQEKTNQMSASYEISKEYPRPKTTLILDKPGFAGLGWVVVHTSQKKMDEPGAPGKPKVVTKQFACHKCPAQFFKSVALQHHLTLHGGKDQFECRSCDYRVKTYGNLIKHESVHGLEPRIKAKAAKSKKLPTANFGGSSGIPSSGTELFQHRTEQIKREQTTPSFASTLSVDPEFGILIHGSPDFVYPTTLKNGKMKEKRYKCHKCPSAFEKREQYKTHVSLHGAKSKFKCEKCDYSVRYYANYKQHTKKHDVNEKCLFERRASVLSKASEESSNEIGYEGSCSGSTTVTERGTFGVGMSPEKPDASGPPPTAKAAKTLHISVADQQAVVLMQEKISDNGVNVADQLFRCYYCPYSHQRKDAVENHEHCHFNPKGNYVCEFCNYTVPQPHFLREHQKLHFGFMKGVKPEAYMKCDRLEIWMETEEGKVLIFKDNGTGVKEESRFEPQATINEEESEYKKMYVNVKTGEEFTPKKEERKLDEEVDEDVSKSIKKPFDLSEVQLSDDSSTPSMSSLSSPLHMKEDVPEVEDDCEIKKEPLEDEELAQEEEVDIVEDEDDDSEMPEEYEDDNTVTEVIETVEMEEDASGEIESNNIGSEVESSDAEMETPEVRQKYEVSSIREEDIEAASDKADEFEINELPEIVDQDLIECVKAEDISETELEDVNKTLSEESDSNDSESSSSSSSSCSSSDSGTSCSSSDSSDVSSDEDDDKEQNANDEPKGDDVNDAVTTDDLQASIVDQS